MTPETSAATRQAGPRSSSYGAAVEVELLGAVAAEAYALDSGALSRVVKDAAPNAVVHLLTAIPARINPRRMSRDLAQTNRLRTEGTRNLLYAAEHPPRQFGPGRRRLEVA